MHQHSARQTACLLLVIFIGWSLTMSAADGRSGWLAIVLAALCSLPFTAVCCLPAERTDQPDWFHIPAAVFGRGGGLVYHILLSALAFWSLTMTVRGGVVFLRTVSDGEWQVWLLTAALLLCAAAAAQHGKRQLLLWTEPILWAVLTALVLSLVISASQLDFSELLPVSFDALPSQTYLLLSAPFAEVFYAAAVLGTPRSQTVRSGLLRGCAAAGLVLCLIYLRNICLLGAEGAARFPYPSYTAAGLLTLGNSFQRGEVLISGSLIVCTAARAALLLSFLSHSLVQIVPHTKPHSWVWSAAAVSGIVCIVCASSSHLFFAAQQLYQQLLFPLLLIAALLLTLGILVHPSD